MWRGRPRPLPLTLILRETCKAGCPISGISCEKWSSNRRGSWWHSASVTADLGTPWKSDASAPRQRFRVRARLKPCRKWQERGRMALLGRVSSCFPFRDLHEILSSPSRPSIELNSLKTLRKYFSKNVPKHDPAFDTALMAIKLPHMGKGEK